MYGRNQGAEERESFNPSKGTALCKSWEGSQARDRSVRKVRGRGMVMKMGGGVKEGWDGLF